MRIYASLQEATKEIERDLVEIGAKVTTKSMQDKVGQFSTQELFGYQFSVPATWNADDSVLAAKHLLIEPTVYLPYLNQELADRFDGVKNPGKAWGVRKDEWEPYLHEGRFSYTYPERIWDPTNQFGHCVNVLKHDPLSRQAIVQVYDKHRDFPNTGGRARIPCSLTYQFISRGSDSEPKLHCIYTMRSCDFYRHWLYDISLAMRTTETLARRLGWGAGNVIMQIASFHAYHSDLEGRMIF
jgi:thymidylate synthase